MGDSFDLREETYGTLACNADLLCSFNTKRGTVYDLAMNLASKGYLIDEASAHNLAEMSALHADDNLKSGSFVMSLPGLLDVQHRVPFNLRCK